LSAHARGLLVSAVVLGELRAGFALGTRVAQNESELVRFLGSPRVSIQTIDDRIAVVYAAVYAQLRRQGTPIPTNDLWIAAGAMAANAALFSYDAHFASVDGLSIVTQRG
jgi:tRNA(fMet)-specific endonuclease VapC